MSASTILSYVNLVAGVGLSGVILGYSLEELYSGETLPAPPTSVLLILLVLVSFSQLITSGIGLVGEIQKDVITSAMRTASAQSHHMTAGRVLLLTALYAGLTNGDKDLWSDTWGVGEGLFFGALLYKIHDAVTDIVAVYAGVYSSELQKDEPDKVKRQDDFTAFGALALALVVFLFALGGDEAYDADTQTFSNVTLSGDENPQPYLLWSMILIIGVLAIVFFGVGLMQLEDNLLSTIGIISSLASYVVGGLLALQVGKSFHATAYNTDDGDFLPANFSYFGAGLLALLAAGKFDAKAVADDNSTKSKGVVRDAILFAMAAGAFGLWSVQTLYQNASYEVKDDNGHPVLVNIDGVDQYQTSVSKARELGMYAMIIVIFVSLHGFLIKIVETVLKAGGNLCNIFKGVKGDDSSYLTLRAEQTLIFALTAAVLAGSRVAQGDAPALEDGTIISLWFVFIVGFGGRVLSFVNDLFDGANAEGDKDATETWKAIAWKADVEKIFQDGDVPLHELGAVLSIILSFAAHTALVFDGSRELIPEDATMTQMSLGVSWILHGVHVLLTVIGLFTNYHAGRFPAVRFGVSTFVILSLALVTGERILLPAQDQYSIPALVLYVTYDVLAKGKAF